MFCANRTTTQGLSPFCQYVADWYIRLSIDRKPRQHRGILHGYKHHIINHHMFAALYPPDANYHNPCLQNVRTVNPLDILPFFRRSMLT